MTISRSTHTFANIADLVATQAHEPSDTYRAAFAETVPSVRLVASDDAITVGTPDPRQMKLGVEMLVATLFDLLRDTRLESIADRLAWGIVHSFHKVSSQLDRDADRAARQVGSSPVTMMVARSPRRTGKGADPVPRPRRGARRRRLHARPCRPDLPCRDRKALVRTVRHTGVGQAHGLADRRVGLPRRAPPALVRSECADRAARDRLGRADLGGSCPDLGGGSTRSKHGSR